jgi:hypothetical protein
VTAAEAIESGFSPMKRPRVIVVSLAAAIAVVVTLRRLRCRGQCQVLVDFVLDLAAKLRGGIVVEMVGRGRASDWSREVVEKEVARRRPFRVTQALLSFNR